LPVIVKTAIVCRPLVPVADLPWRPLNEPRVVAGTAVADPMVRLEVPVAEPGLVPAGGLAALDEVSGLVDAGGGLVAPLPTVLDEPVLAVEIVVVDPGELDEPVVLAVPVDAVDDDPPDDEEVEVLDGEAPPRAWAT
jgi:hypothetical protein